SLCLAAPEERARPYLAPWIVLDTSSAGFDGWTALMQLPGARISPNSGGVLFDVLAGSGKPILEAFDPEAPRWVGPLVSTARAAAESLALGRPIFLRAASVPDVDALLALAGREATAGVPFVAAPMPASPTTADLTVLARLGALLSGDFGNDTRPARARSPAGA